MNEERCRCLRREKTYQGQDDLEFDNIYLAKEECSKNWRCIGIEYPGTKYGAGSRFKLCLDAIYASTASDKYGRITHSVLRKAAGWGTCRH